MLPLLPICLEARPAASLPSAFPSAFSWVGFAESWEEDGLCVTSLEGSAGPLSQKGICIPFKATVSPFHSLLWHPPWEGHYLLHNFRAGGKFLRVDRVSVPRDVLEQLLGSYAGESPSCLLAARKGFVAAVGS